MIELLDAAPAVLGWLAQSLSARGHAVRHRTDAWLPDRDATRPPDLVVAYRSRWDASAAAWLQDLRCTRRGTCVVATGPGDVPQDRVAFLEAGADDCLHLGLPRAEILARLDAALRRLPQGGTDAPPFAGTAATLPRHPRTIVLAGGWRFLPGQRHVISEDGRATLRLTSAECALLRVLADAAGGPVDRDAISRAVFRRPWRIEDRAVDSLVKRLRRKLVHDPVVSVRGVGYALLPAEISQPLPASPGGAPTDRMVARGSAEVAPEGLGTFSNPK